jgi:hypothetical protein
MAIRTDFTAGEVLAAADLNDTFAAKLNIAGGKVLQVVRATDATDRTTTSTSFVDATSSVTITPQKSDSAVLVVASFQANPSSASQPNIQQFFQITDSSNNAISGGQGSSLGGVDDSAFSGTRSYSSHQIIWAYATPATTSATTYKLRFRAQNANMTAKLSNSESTGQMYAIEVSA